MSDIVNRLRFDFRDRDADEVEEMQQEIDRLRAELAQRTAEVAKATAQRNAALDAREITQRTLDGIDGVLSQRTAERDAARRMYCVEMSRQSSDPKRFTPEWAARLFGWDCFEDNERRAT